jgi:hopene-associated glycosyltransferase HpnB
MTVDVLTLLAAVSLLAWLVLLFWRGGFWRADQRLGEERMTPPVWPDVVAVIPARDEAATIGSVISSLLDQDYPGGFSIVLVDDNSSDGTAEVARAAAKGSEKLQVLTGSPLEPGWTGKLWAMEQGIRLATLSKPGYFLLTDADITHDPGNLRRLVAKAELDGRDMVSLMVQLVCDSFWERLLIPAFIFFFQKLYPFPWVNERRHRVAAAAGGCVLLRRSALERAKGLEPIRDRIIDDCALAARIKAGGAIWLGLEDRVISLRGYDDLSGLWRMVTRTAFEQLERSVGMLAVAVIGMTLIYLVPPIAVFWGVATHNDLAAGLGAFAWLLMALAYRPTLTLYEQPFWRAFLLPLAALLYTLMTLDSARRAWQGQGGAWKGRHYPRASGR